VTFVREAASNRLSYAPGVFSLRLVLVAALLAAGAACSPLPHTWDPVEAFPVVSAAHPTPADPAPDGLRLLTWNLKFGGARVDFFFDGWGDRVHLSEAEVSANVDALIGLIEEVDPDILLAQEVDVGSRRSAYVDMVDEILQRTAFNHAAFVPVWVVDHIPQNGLGKVEMGQAVFSRYPIVRNTRVDLPQSGDNSAVTNYFWLHRAVQITEVEVSGNVLTVVNNHPTAYALDGTKQIHLAEIFDWSAQADGPVVTGGDFNVIPPGSLVTEGFADNAPADVPGVTEVAYTPDEIAALEPFYESFSPAIDLAAYQAATEPVEQERFLTHSVSQTTGFTQKLDYLFTTEAWREAHTLQAVGDGAPAVTADPNALSDHAPILGVLEWP